MTRTLLVIACIIFFFTACAPNEAELKTAVETAAEPTVIQNFSPSQVASEPPVPTVEASVTSIPAEAPTPTPLPTATPKPKVAAAPYATDFSKAELNWEVLLAKNNTQVTQPNEAYVLEASGKNSIIFSSPKDVIDATELVIEVDVTIAAAEGSGDMSGIFCGYVDEQTVFSFGINSSGYAAILKSNESNSLLSVRFVKLFDSNVQQTHRLRAICSAEGLGLAVDGDGVLQYPITGLKPGRIGLFTKGAQKYGDNGTDIVDATNVSVFDNFSTTAMKAEYDWARTRPNPFDYLKIGEVLYDESFAEPVGTWNLYSSANQSAQLENGKLTLYASKAASMTYSALESFKGFNSGVVLETDFTVLPGVPELYEVGFICEVDFSGTNFYTMFYWAGGSVDFFKFEDMKWKNIGSTIVLGTDNEPPLEPGRTYQLTGICGGGFLAMLMDGVPQLIIQIPDQVFQKVGPVALMSSSSEAEIRVQFDNFKISRVEATKN